MAGARAVDSGRHVSPAIGARGTLSEPGNSGSVRWTSRAANSGRSVARVPSPAPSASTPLNVVTLQVRSSSAPASAVPASTAGPSVVARVEVVRPRDSVHATTDFPDHARQLQMRSHSGVLVLDGRKSGVFPCGEAAVENPDVLVAEVLQCERSQ